MTSASARDFAPEQADTVPTGGVAPLPGAVCNTLAGIWSVAKIKLDLCVTAAFFPHKFSRHGCLQPRQKIRDRLPECAARERYRPRRGEPPRRTEGARRDVPARFRYAIQAFHQADRLLQGMDRAQQSSLQELSSALTGLRHLDLPAAVAG